MSFKRLAVSLALVFFLQGCGSKGPRLKIAVNKEPQVCEVAVLPIINQTKMEGVGRMLTRVLMSEMVRYGIWVAEEGVVKRFLERERCLPGKCVPARLVMRLGREIGVKAVVGGIVTEAREVGDEVKLGFLLWVRDTSDGRIMWGTYYYREGEDYRKVLHFGKISSLSGLTKKMVDEILETWMEKGLFRCRIS